MSRDDPPPTILRDKNALVRFIQPWCEVISEILIHKLVQYKNKFFMGGIRDAADAIASWHHL